MQQTLKTMVKGSYAWNYARTMRNWLRLLCNRFHRRITVNEAKIIDRYMNQEGVKKLQLGCGFNILEGWLNSDDDPKSRDVIRIDATQSYRFADETFDYIFSEHMIEHLPFEQGLFMLKECFRVLKDGGKIRISTPDLAFLIALYRTDKTDLQKEYIKWSTQVFISGAPPYEDTFVINNYVRAWGHKFIYDEKILRFSLEESGFKEIKRFALNASEDLAFRDMENAQRMPEGFLQLESMTLEGTKRLSNTSN
jgi:predicted SAM-dependent methyltransferase